MVSSDAGLSYDGCHEHHFTLRAVAVGLLIGTVICFSNMYFGLQTGWISMMSLQASLLGYAIFRPLQSRLQVRFSPVENVVLQTVAVATATMPLAAGFVGVIPALGLLTEEDHPGGPIVLSFSQLLLWSLGVAFFGVFFAIPLRKETIIREKLRFPSGTATAQMIQLLHQQPSSTIRPRHSPSSSSSSSIRQRQFSSAFSDQEQAASLPCSPQSNRPPRRSSSSDIYFHDQPWSVALLPMPSPSIPESAPTTTSSETASEVAAILEERWTLKLHALAASFSLSSLYTLLSYFFPVISALPIFNWIVFDTIDFRSWEWYFTPSLSYMGQGIIMGLPTTLSMLLGCCVGWGVLSPIAYYAGWAPGPVGDWKTGSKGWILWISLSVMIAESLVSLGDIIVQSIQARRHHRPANTEYIRVTTDSTDVEHIEAQATRIAERYSDDESDDTPEEVIETRPVDVSDGQISNVEDDAPSHQLVPLPVTIGGLIASTGLCVYVVARLFGTETLPIIMIVVAILLAMLLSVLGVRALGQTDLNPVSGIGKISQVLFSVFMPGNIVANLIAGAIAEAGSQQAGDLMQDLKTGHLLRASPKAQFYGQLLGSFVSAFTATGAYYLYTLVYTIPGPEFPVPTAQVWLDMARLMNGRPLPPHVMEFVIAFGVLFACLTWLKERHSDARWHRYLPQGIAFAIGMYNPPNFTLARVVGGVMAHLWDKYCNNGAHNHHEESMSSIGSFFDRYRNKVGKILIIIIASGFVLGEGTFAIVNMTMQACHVPHF
ncbi:OPT oligopeptide transporter protein-domain-containing protein [Radiomyces spectabilis]|uniref:OPT oligopeptide transporter protein-domain-containing protein n=1 Tax=Radiomyces spectabilis TaxID=64574 RepID=UPI00221E3956|nr:OPT oligopeptide transporter protein-domain-containing protein [Radiomyces spectabilis]KAI8364695.1 OPT oligopeptide transporter protein-domain-containing protein [Radiomyces spectabilis]